MDISLSKRCVKELVVALELSGNETFLAEALNWAEKCSKDIAVPFPLTFLLITLDIHVSSG